jgi:hypothetical protein
MQRRSFLKNSTAALAASGCSGSGWLRALATEVSINLHNAGVVMSETSTKRESNRRLKTRSACVTSMRGRNA